MECTGVPELRYSDFYSRLVNSSGCPRLPLWGNIELTDRCNLKCQPCYINRPARDQGALQNELSTVEMTRLLSEIAGEGCLCLLFTGGEPLLRSDFADIYVHAKKLGLILTVFSNGTTITPELADVLAEWPPRTVEITLYGRSQQTYEAVTRVPASYSRCLRGIDLLLERNIRFSLKTVVITTNLHELESMKAFAAELGVDFRFDPVMNPRLDGCFDPLNFRISPEDVLALDRGDPCRWENLKKFSQQFFGPPSEPEGRYHCGAGINCFHIDSNGRLSVCLMAREPAYDLRAGSFREGWREFLPAARARKRDKPSPCQSCDLHALCHQCAGWAQLEASDPETPVNYLCRLAHLRADALGLDYHRKERIPDHG